MDARKPYYPEDERVIPRDAVLTAALALAALLFFSWQILSLSREEVSQFSKYPYAALKYLNGTIAPERVLDYSPLYLWLHVAARRLFEDPVPAVLWVHIGLLTASAALLFLLLRRRCSLVLSLTGALFFLLGESVVIYGYVLEPEPLMIFLLIAVVYFGQQRGPAAGFLTGLALSLCLLTRPSFAPLIVLVPLFYLLRSRTAREALPSLAVFLVPLLVGAVAISARNYGLQGTFSLTVMNPGTVFFYGNNPQSAGTAVAYPPVVQDMADTFAGESDYHHAVVRLMARRTAGVRPGADGSGGLVGSTLNYIADHPLRFVSLTASRVFYIFNGYRWHDLDVAWNVERSLRAGKTPFVLFPLISALALAGLASGLRDWRELALPYAVFLNQLALMSLTLTTDRQRVCIYAFFVFFAVLALSRLPSNWKTLAAVSAPLAVVLSLETGLMKDNRHAMASAGSVPGIIAAADAQKSSLDLGSATAGYVRALALGPWAFQNGKPSDLPVPREELYGMAAEELPPAGGAPPSVRFDRALLLIEARRFGEAEDILAGLARGGYAFNPDNDRIPDPLYHLGRAALLRGDAAKAVERLENALRRHPGEPAALAQLACIPGNESRAETLFRYFDELDARFLLGRACLESGQPERAAAYLGPLAALLPEFARGRIMLAAALGGMGKYNDAAELYLTTTGEHPRTVMLEERIVPIFHAWAAGGSAEARYWYGIVLRQYGRFREALPHLQLAERSGRTGAAAEVRRLRALLGSSEQRPGRRRTVPSS